MVVVSVRRALKSAELKELHREIDKALFFLSSEPLPPLFLSQKAAESPPSPQTDSAKINGTTTTSTTAVPAKSVTTPAASMAPKNAAKSPSNSAVKQSKSASTAKSKNATKPPVVTRKASSVTSTAVPASAKAKAKSSVDEDRKKQLLQQLRQLPNFSHLQQNSIKFSTIEKWLKSDQGTNQTVSAELLQLVEEFDAKFQQVSDPKDDKHTSKLKKKPVAETLDEHLLNEQQQQQQEQQQHRKLNTNSRSRHHGRSSRGPSRSRAMELDESSSSSSSDEMEFEAPPRNMRLPLPLLSLDEHNTKTSGNKRTALSSSSSSATSGKRRRRNLRSDGSSQQNAILLSSEEEEVDDDKNEQPQEQEEENSSTEDEDMTPKKLADTNQQVIDLSDPDVYEVESVMDMKKGRVVTTAYARKARRDPDLFLIKWKGYDELTWEPASNLSPNMVTFYHQHQQALYVHKHQFHQLEDRKVVPNLMTGKQEVIYLIVWKHDTSRSFWEAQNCLPPRTVVLLEKIARSSRFHSKNSTT